MSKKPSMASGVISLVILTILGAIVFLVLPVQAKVFPELPPVAQSSLGGEGNGGPNSLRPGAPIANCNAEFNQGQPDDPIKGCFFSPMAPSLP